MPHICFAMKIHRTWKLLSGQRDFTWVILMSNKPVKALICIKGLMSFKTIDVNMISDQYRADIHVQPQHTAQAQLGLFCPQS